MGVDTKHLAQEADHAERYDRSVLLNPVLVRQCVGEIDSLRIKLAEARKQAIPWRDGPLTTRERDKYDRGLFVVGVDDGENKYIRIGYLATGIGFLSDGGRVVTKPSHIKKWCTYDEMIAVVLPTEPTQ